MMVLMPIALDTDDAGVCGQERGGVDGWTGGRVEGGYSRLSRQGAKISAQNLNQNQQLPVEI